jgi:hypothetical protein
VSARPIWWSEADQAELDVLIDALVGAAWAHKRCARCRELNSWCEPMREAFEALIEWRRSRGLRSRAEFLRDLDNSRKEAA